MRKHFDLLILVMLIGILLGLPQMSYADWGIGINFGPGYHRDSHFYYRWHDHPQWGWRVHYLPHGYHTIWVGGARYYYYDGLYYNYVAGDYVLVTPPVGAYVTVIPPDFQAVIINGRTYYVDNGIYYIRTHHGYKVVGTPVVYAQPAFAGPNVFPINVPSSSGYVTVLIKRSGNGYVGPQGEFYAAFPSVAQLRVMYAR